MLIDQLVVTTGYEYEEDNSILCYTEIYLLNGFVAVWNMCLIVFFKQFFKSWIVEELNLS